jgi:cyclopropane-fatty-acyl-phospholipid synthase
MNPKTAGGWLAERAPLPDSLLRSAIAARVAKTRRRLASVDGQAEQLRSVAEMSTRPIAEFTLVANRQHYELPVAFFEQVLGPRRKYSCCLYEPGVDCLATAEERALAVTAERAALADGQSILELGCGWGALSLWMAQTLPAARITAVSNSLPQRRYIEREALARGIGNLQIITTDINEFTPERRYDRIVSVEMFEHVANWPFLLGRIANWLEPDGRLFLHVFSHRAVPYRFDHADSHDWIARHFFTGGIMPSHGLIRLCDHDFVVEEEWRWSGEHYRRTASDWLANFDRRRSAIRPILSQVYGEGAALWCRRWRLFLLATAGLFGDSDGSEWGISHYRLKLRTR